MKDHVRELVGGLDPLAGRNILREYLQARSLEGLQRVGAMSALAFQGGTALRFLYGLPRYSEDLDFALEGARASYDLKAWMTGIARQFERENYVVPERSGVAAAESGVAQCGIAAGGSGGGSRDRGDVACSGGGASSEPGLGRDPWGRAAVSGAWGGDGGEGGVAGTARGIGGRELGSV